MVDDKSEAVKIQKLGRGGGGKSHSGYPNPKSQYLPRDHPLPPYSRGSFRGVIFIGIRVRGVLFWSFERGQRSVRVVLEGSVSGGNLPTTSSFPRSHQFQNTGPLPPPPTPFKGTISRSYFIGLRSQGV